MLRWSAGSGGGGSGSLTGSGVTSGAGSGLTGISMSSLFGAFELVGCHAGSLLGGWLG